MTRGWAAAEATLSEEEAPPARSRASRARGVHDPREKPAAERVDWEAVENAYVWGDTLGQREDGSYIRKYPTFKQLGKTFGVSPSVVHYYAKRGNWAERRLKAIKQTKEEFDVELAKSRGRKAASVVEVLDSWIEKFGTNLQGNKVEATSVSDLNTIVRLRSFVLGGGDSRTETRVTLTLELLRERHAAMRGHVAAAEGEVAGELVEGSGVDAVLAGEVQDEEPAQHTSKAGAPVAATT